MSKRKSEADETPNGKPGCAPVIGSVDFVCEACGLEGQVENPKHMESVSCPECNARYLYWPDGIAHGEKSPWKCVVRPVFVPPPTKTEW